MTVEIDVFELPVFSDANIWSMWPADKLNELAEDIKDNGFDHRYPITIAEVNGEWMLLDGRNRREAAKIAGIIPPVIVTDVDPKLAVHRSNNQNRDATPGQKAMATAMAFPENTDKGGRGKKGKTVDSSNGFDKSTLSRARYVLRNNPTPEGQDYPQRCLDIMAGTLSLTEAYELTQADVKRREEEARIRAENAEKLNDVRARYPNLAALVDDERLTLDQAIASAEQSDREAREQAERDAIEAAEQERIKREELALKATFEKQVESIRQYAPDLADKMVSGSLSFDAAVRMVDERKANDKAKRDANLESLYRLCEIAPSFTNDKGIEYFKGLLIEYGEEYRDRWRRSVKESLTNLKNLVDNRDEILRMIKEVLK